jgi:hypothetical protein
VTASQPEGRMQARAHDQAFLELRAALPPASLDAALQCSARLAAALPDPRQLDRNLVLVAYGGGKDSSYTLAFVRAMQLILFRVHGTTFRLRSATNRHAGMPRAVMENIHREYQALRMSGDPSCELLLVDGNEVTPFDVNSPQRDHIIRRNRLDILMTGHRTFADGRPTFCNACNISVMNSFGRAAAYGDGADLIITGDSLQEQRQYARWVGRLARRLAPAAGTAPTPPAGVGRFLSNIDRIAQAYFTDIHGPEAAGQEAERRVVTADVPSRLRFFSIYSDTSYAAGHHMEFLTGFLGFRFDDIAFSFTESDCGNPALMAHLRGLKCERVYQRSYAEGIAQYVDFAVDLMRKKDFPADLIALIQERYQGEQAVPRMRDAASRYALATFGLAEEQLVCMAYSPFAGKAAGLAGFLRREHPELADREAALRALLDGQPDGDPRLAAELERISGLGLDQLRVLYRSSLRSPDGRSGTEVIDAVLADDPHKAVIISRPAKDGPSMLEQISGR